MNNDLPMHSTVQLCVLQIIFSVSDGLFCHKEWPQLIINIKVPYMYFGGSFKTAFDFLGAGVIKFETTRGFFQLLKGLCLHLYLLIYHLSIYYDLMPTKNKNKL